MVEKSGWRRSEEMTHTPVSYVERLSAGLGTWESTSAVTRERSPMDAHSAGGVSVRQVTWKNTRGSTQGRNLTSAISAERASAGERIWKGTRRSTLERIYTHRKCEGSNRNDLLTAKSVHTQRRLCEKRLFSPLVLSLSCFWTHSKANVLLFSAAGLLTWSSSVKSILFLWDKTGLYCTYLTKDVKVSQIFTDIKA